MKCAKCHRTATMVSPEPLCDLHWHLWFCGTDLGHRKYTVKRHVRFIQQNMKASWRRHGRPKDWRSQWNLAEEVVMEANSD